MSQQQQQQKLEEVSGTEDQSDIDSSLVEFDRVCNETRGGGGDEEVEDESVMETATAEQIMELLDQLEMTSSHQSEAGRGGGRREGKEEVEEEEEVIVQCRHCTGELQAV